MQLGPAQMPAVAVQRLSLSVKQEVIYASSKAVVDVEAKVVQPRETPYSLKATKAAAASMAGNVVEAHRWWHRYYPALTRAFVLLHPADSEAAQILSKLQATAHRCGDGALMAAAVEKLAARVFTHYEKAARAFQGSAATMPKLNDAWKAAMEVLFTRFILSNA